MKNNNEVQIPHFEKEALTKPEGAADTSHAERITNGPIIILLIVLLVAILGGMSYWFTMMQKDTPTVTPLGQRPTAAENNEPESTTAEAEAESMGVVSSSDEIPAIEADVESTNLDSLESELDAIDAEIDGEVTEEPKAP